MITEPIESKEFKSLEPQVIKWLKSKGIKSIDFGDSFLDWHHLGKHWRLELKVKK